MADEATTLLYMFTLVNNITILKCGRFDAKTTSFSNYGPFAVKTFRKYVDACKKLAKGQLDIKIWKLAQFQIFFRIFFE